jgi:hypothetical protein
MKKLKFLFVAILTIVFATTFTSCGGDDSPSNSGSEQRTDKYNVKVGEEIIEDGSTWTTTETGDRGNMVLTIKNISDENIYLKIKVVSLSDNVPTDNTVELCMGECYFNIQQNAVYPEGTPFILTPGQSSPDGATHVKNNDDQHGDISIGLKIFETDAQGNELPNGQTLSFTYFYDAP